MEYENPITRARERDATIGERKLGQEMFESLKEIIARRIKAEVTETKDGKKTISEDDSAGKVFGCTTMMNELIPIKPISSERSEGYHLGASIWHRYSPVIYIIREDRIIQETLERRHLAEIVRRHLGEIERRLQQELVRRHLEILGTEHKTCKNSQRIRNDVENIHQKSDETDVFFLNGSTGNISNVRGKSNFTAFVIRYAVLLLLCMVSTSECNNKIEFDLETKPAYFGGNVTVYCRMASSEPSVQHMAWSKNITKQVALKTHSYYPSKYLVAVDYVSDYMYYRLKILHFAVDDVNVLYRCDFGFDSLSEPLNLDNDNFIALPHNDTTDDVFETTKGHLTGFMNISNIYPIPRCEILFQGHNYTKDVIMTYQQGRVFYNVTLNFARNVKLSGSHGVLNISCYFGTKYESVLIKRINNDISLQYEDRGPMAIEEIIGMTIGIVMGMVVTCIAIKKCRPQSIYCRMDERGYYQNIVQTA